MPIDYDALAKQYGFSREAVLHITTALTRGNGQQAQFNHPELGGMGQWQPGMIMIGDAFNHALKARVDALCRALVYEAQQNASDPMATTQKSWWPDDLGKPTMVGSQNGSKYAYFESSQRLVIMRQGQLKIYDTTGKTLTGVSQQQSNASESLVFQTTQGTIAEADLDTIAD